MVAKPLILASRSSRLALAQLEEAIEVLRHNDPQLEVTRLKLTSPGDRDLSTPLSLQSVPDDFFTRDIDQALLDGRADLAVHSAKDLPQSMPDGLIVAALLPARDIRDALVLRRGITAQDVHIAGTSSSKREQGLRDRFPDATIKPIRGDIDQRLAQLDNGDYDALVVAACALDRLGLTDRITDYFRYDPVPQQGRLALVVRSDHHDLIRRCITLDVRRTAGLVAIVGCPADPSMLSTRARSYLEQADIVYHDRLIPQEALDCIRGEKVFVGKHGRGKSTVQSDIHRMMLHSAEKGLLVVRFQGGDPLIFGHLDEQLEFLHAWNLRTDLVPALTAAQVAAAHAGAPLTHRGDGGHVHILCGHTKEGMEPDTPPGPGSGNLAIYMGTMEVNEWAQRLIEAGWPKDSPILVAEQMGEASEGLYTRPLNELGAQPIKKPAVFLVGVKCHPTLQRTLFVGTDPERFLNQGPLIHHPLIQLAPIPLAERVAAIQAEESTCNGVFFPSKFAVRIFMEALMEHSDARWFAGRKVLSVGPTTSETLRGYGLRSDASVDSFGGIQALADGMPEGLNGRYLYPCSNVAPAAKRVETLKARGIELRPTCFYRNESTPARPLPSTPFHRVLFTSGSTVKAYFKQYPEERHAERMWIAVGPSTQAALEAHALDPRKIMMV